jgi:hypothetical protein
MENKNKKIKAFSTVMVDSITKGRIKGVSKITGISQAVLLRELFDSLAHVYCEFESATFSCDYSPRDNIVSIIVHGTKRKGCLTFGTCKNEQELADIARNKILGDL